MQMMIIDMRKRPQCTTHLDEEILSAELEHAKVKEGQKTQQ